MKEEFIANYQIITRRGSDKLLEWLRGTDFFTAPASTRFHLSRPGGLAEHSVHVYQRLASLVDKARADGEAWAASVSAESVAIVGLLHDLCKTNFYAETTRNVKNEETGKWEKVPYYTVEDQMPYGHGEKSVFIIERFMRLTVEEATAIRFHMGGFAQQPGDYSLSEAFKRYPLAVMAHCADLQATYLDEGEEEI